MRFLLACEKNGEPEEARRAYESMKEVVLAFGPQNLPTDEATTFFLTIKRLADEAATRGDPRGAIALLRIIVDGDRAGVQTFRGLAEMLAPRESTHGRRGPEIVCAAVIVKKFV